MTLEELKARLFLLDANAGYSYKNNETVYIVRYPHYALYNKEHSTLAYFRLSEFDLIVRAIDDADTKANHYIWG